MYLDINIYIYIFTIHISLGCYGSAIQSMKADGVADCSGSWVIAVQM